MINPKRLGTLFLITGIIIPLSVGAQSTNSNAIVSAPIAVLAGVILVLGLMLFLRVHAFLALLIAALVVSVLTVGLASSVAPVLLSFGETAGKIGVVIALAAVIGKCLLASGAADRIVGANISLLGEKRAPVGLMGGGFFLAIPVFFDTVFYLLVPLARKLHKRTGAGYALCLMALAGGAAAAHALVPPTPGPLLVADAFGVSIAQALGFGLLIAIPGCIVAYQAAKWLDIKTPLIMKALPGEELEEIADPGRPQMNLLLALAPIVVPILLIGTREAAGVFLGGAAKPAWFSLITFLGNPSIALFISALIGLMMLYRTKNMTFKAMSAEVEESLLGAGVIILITAAGGAFGAALKATGIADVIAASIDLSTAASFTVLLGAFAVASMLKIAQGSSTVAMIVGSGMVAAVVNLETLSFAPVYLALAVGCGSLVGSWMNDSGFWIFAKMGGLTEKETLRTWTPLFAIVGIAAFAVTILLSAVFPMR